MTEIPDSHRELSGEWVTLRRLGVVLILLGLTLYLEWETITRFVTQAGIWKLGFLTLLYLGVVIVVDARLSTVFGLPVYFAFLLPSLVVYAPLSQLLAATGVSLPQWSLIGGLIVGQIALFYHDFYLTIDETIDEVDLSIDCLNGECDGEISTLGMGTDINGDYDVLYCENEDVYFVKYRDGPYCDRVKNWPAARRYLETPVSELDPAYPPQADDSDEN